MDFDRLPDHLYLCNPGPMPLIMETSHLGKSISGVYATFTGGYMERIEKMSNATLKFIAYPGLGQKINSSGHFSGCFGMLQEGKADAILAPVNYPSSVDNIGEGSVLYDTRIGYMASFPPVSYAPFDLAKTFEAFDAQVWFTIILYLMVIRLVIWLKDKLIGRLFPGRERMAQRGEDTFHVLTHFTNDGELGYAGATMKVLYMVLSLFSFFILMEYNNEVNTGLVTSTPPRIFNSYDDLIRNKIKPLFMKESTDYKHYESAPKGQGERKMWDFAVKRWGMKNLFIEMSPISLIGNAVRVGAFQCVCIAQSIILEWVRSTICNIYPKSDERINIIVNAYNATYKDLYVKHNGFDHQIYFKYSDLFPAETKQWAVGKMSPYKGFMLKFISRLTEYGHSVYGYRSFSESDLAKEMMGGGGDNILGRSYPEKLYLRENCMHQTPVDTDRGADEMSVVTIRSLKTCFGIFAGLIFIAFILLIYEKIEASIANKKSKVRRQIVNDQWIRITPRTQKIRHT